MPRASPFLYGDLHTALTAESAAQWQWPLESRCPWVAPVELEGFVNAHCKIPPGLAGYGKEVPDVDAIRVGDSGANMKGFHPGPEGVLGAFERTVRLDAELRAVKTTPVWHRDAVGWPSDSGGVALGTANAIRPSLCDEPSLRQVLVLVTLENVKQRLVN